jgi:hypothetical protein
MIIAMLLGSSAQAGALDRGKWIEQTARASKTCLANFGRNSVKQRVTITLTVWRIKITKQWTPALATASLPIVF